MVREDKSSQKKNYNSIVKTMLAACKAKGWGVYLEKPDKDYQLATIHVYKQFGLNEVTGVLSVALINDQVKYSIQTTGFYSYGLNDLLDAISIKLKEAGLVKNDKEKDAEASPKPLELLTNILRNFNKVIRQLKRRHNGRPTLEVNDEYDVQDLLHSILRAFFNDIRPEEYTPSYAGSSSRMDFLLKGERVVVETKFASHKLREREIGEQLIVDIKKYQSHPDCDQLYCLVYDPMGILRNPAGLENDLSGRHGKIGVKVIVAPQ